MTTISRLSGLLLLGSAMMFGQASQSTAAADGAAATKAVVVQPKLSPIVKPRLLHSEEAKYTQDAFDHHITGSVEVFIKVDIHGDPTRVLVTRGLGYGLDQEAAKAARLYKFSPATRDGQPFPSIYISRSSSNSRNTRRLSRSVG